MAELVAGVLRDAGASPWLVALASLTAAGSGMVGMVLAAWSIWGWLVSPPGESWQNKGGPNRP